MNIQTHTSGENLVLQYAMLVYTSGKAGWDRRTHVTKHPVSMVGQKPVIRRGVSLTDRDYALFVESILTTSKKSPIAWSNPNVLCDSNDRLIWWRPPTKQSMFFNVDNAACAPFTGDGVFATPGLIFMVKDNNLYIYAVKGSDRPTPETKLYQAPFLNVWGSGRVCVGNATRPNQEQARDLLAWERMFFGSRFTHPNFTEKDRLTKGICPGRFWRQQIKKPRAKFPEMVLVDINWSAQDLFAVDFASRAEALKAQGEF